MRDQKLSRRSFFQMALGAIAIAPAIIGMNTANAQACSNTPPKGKKVAKPGVGMGKSLDYVEVAGESKNAKFAKGQDCNNCKFYQDKKADSGYAPCTMMGMSFVAGCGWCKSYAKK